MKRASVSFDQSHSADDDAKEKLKYQTLLREYLEQQKEYVSRKKKLQAAKQKRDLVLAEVRFLKRKHKCLMKSKAPNTNKALLHLPNMDKETTTMQSGRNLSTVDQLVLSNPRLKDDGAEGRDHAYEENVRCAKKITNHLIQDKVEGKRKILLA